MRLNSETVDEIRRVLHMHMHASSIAWAGIKRAMGASHPLAGVADPSLIQNRLPDVKTLFCDESGLLEHYGLVRLPATHFVMRADQSLYKSVDAGPVAAAGFEFVYMPSDVLHRELGDHNRLRAIFRWCHAEFEQSFVPNRSLDYSELPGSNKHAGVMLGITDKEYTVVPARVLAHAYAQDRADIDVFHDNNLSTVDALEREIELTRESLRGGCIMPFDRHHLWERDYRHVADKTVFYPTLTGVYRTIWALTQIIVGHLYAGAYISKTERNRFCFKEEIDSNGVEIFHVTSSPSAGMYSSNPNILAPNSVVFRLDRQTDTYGYAIQAQENLDVVCSFIEKKMKSIGGLSWDSYGCQALSQKIVILYDVLKAVWELGREYTYERPFMVTELPHYRDDRVTEVLGQYASIPTIPAKNALGDFVRINDLDRLFCAPRPAPQRIIM